MTILSTFLNELFPFARLLLVNRRVAARLADETPDPRQARWAGLGREKLLALLAEEWDRAKALDEKLFKQVIGDEREGSCSSSHADVEAKASTDGACSGESRWRERWVNERVAAACKLACGAVG